MKKYDLLKVLGITFLIVFFMSWVIPAGSFTSGTFSSADAAVPIGLYDLVRLPFISLATFIQYILLILVIGGFYGVLNRTGVYTKLVESIVKKYKSNSNKFMIITIIIFALLSSIIGANNVIFILIPFFITILLKLGFSKINALASTVGAMLVGQIGSTIGFGTWGYLKIVFGQSNTSFTMTSLILIRIILLIIVTTLFIMLVNRKSLLKKEVIVKDKKSKDKTAEEKEEKIDIPLYKELRNEKGILPIIVIISIMFVLLFVGVYNLSYTFGISFLEDFHESLMTTKIGNYEIFSNLIGSGAALGSWGNYDIIAILIITSLVITWIYSIKLSEAVDGFIKGMKEMFAPAMYVGLSCVIFTAILNMNGTDFVNTIVNQFLGKDFSIAGTTITTLSSSFFYNDFYTLIATISSPFSVFDENVIQIIALMFQTMYGLVMLIAPTSIFLLAGLSYLQVPYKEWVKYIYKYVLIIFGVVIIISVIANMMI